MDNAVSDSFLTKFIGFLSNKIAAVDCDGLWLLLFTSLDSGRCTIWPFFATVIEGQISVELDEISD